MFHLKNNVICKVFKCYVMLPLLGLNLICMLPMTKVCACMHNEYIWNGINVLNKTLVAEFHVIYGANAEKMEPYVGFKTLVQRDGDSLLAARQMFPM